VGKYWRYAYERYRALEGKEFITWFDVFAPNGRAPAIGELWRSERHADTLIQIAESKGKSFYRGELAEKIDEFSHDHGGYLSLKDLKGYSPEWVEPLSVHYNGYDVWELPPNGQGIITLMALNILKELHFSCKETVDTYHNQIEALKLAFEDGKEQITDPKYMDIRPESLISEEYAEKKRSLVGDRAREPSNGAYGGGGTVYLATADEEGNMVSYIQSNYMGFGSGLVVPETGIALHNRGNTFSLDPSHINCLEPMKRTYHTIIPGFITQDDSPIGPFGVMGGYMQPQGHLQVLMNLVDFGLNPQACLDAPRWRWEKGKKVVLEDSFPKHIGRALSRRGHEISYAFHSGGFGRGQMIIKNNDGYVGATEPRTDGHIGVW
jgi:gamma-glutamyltranspeptidase/glutathione hydrolase